MNVSFMQVQILVQNPCRKATKILTKPATVVHPAQSRLINSEVMCTRDCHTSAARAVSGIARSRGSDWETGFRQGLNSLDTGIFRLAFNRFSVNVK